MKEDFIEDLKQLLVKYKITVIEYDQFNGNDDYMGTVNYLVFDGQPDYSDTIDDIFKSILK